MEFLYQIPCRLLILLLASGGVGGQASRLAAAEAAPPQGPPPAWVELAATPPAPSGTTADASDHSRRYLLLDTQVHAATAATYHHSVCQILNEVGLRDGSQIQLTYDPSYESLSVHHVRLHRAGESFDKYEPAHIRILQQESDLDRQLYNGEHSALLVLEDVRVGDVIDLAYTRQGANPVFAGHYVDFYWLSWSVPVSRQRLRVIGGSGAEVRHQQIGPTTAPLHRVTTPLGPELRWESENLPPRLPDNNTPSWYVDYAGVEFSDFRNWEEVVRWALPLYDNTGLTDGLDGLVATLAQTGPDPTARIVAALDFVQRDIRYMGFEMGAGSHRPSPPEEVCRRRYGDCKDKARLLCALLQRLGFRAAPVLVNTGLLHTVTERLPSPRAFNHVVVAVWVGDQVYQLDPTFTQQRGPLPLRHTNRYGRGLVIAPDTTDLRTFPDAPNDLSLTSATETFDIPSLTGPADFRVTTVYQGGAARTMRARLQEDSPAELLKAYQEYYARRYPAITTVEPLTWTEEAAVDRLTVREHYRIADLFSPQEGTRERRAEFFPSVLGGLFNPPGSLGRTTPLALRHPVELRTRTIINLPEDWNFTPRQTKEAGAAFAFERRIGGTVRHVELDYAWRSKTDHVRPVDFTEHVRLLSRINETLNYQLTYTPPDPQPVGAAEPASATGYRLNWEMVGLAGTTANLCLGAALLLYWCRPPPRRTAAAPAADPRLTGLGGWLILVGFGVVANPFILLAQYVRQAPNTFDAEIWRRLTDPALETYRAHFAWFQPLEVVGQLILWATTVLLVALYFGRKRAFPAVMIFRLAFQAVFNSGDACLAVWLFPRESSFTPEIRLSLIQSLGSALVWIPYLLRSRRVRYTFTR